MEIITENQFEKQSIIHTVDIPNEKPKYKQFARDFRLRETSQSIELTLIFVRC